MTTGFPLVRLKRTGDEVLGHLRFAVMFFNAMANERRSDGMALGSIPQFDGKSAFLARGATGPFQRTDANQRTPLRVTRKGPGDFSQTIKNPTKPNGGV
jgi:hypothetical protein